MKTYYLTYSLSGIKISKITLACYADSIENAKLIAQDALAESGKYGQFLYQATMQESLQCKHKISNMLVMSSVQL